MELIQIGFDWLLGEHLSIMMSCQRFSRSFNSEKGKEDGKDC